MQTAMQEAHAASPREQELRLLNEEYVRASLGGDVQWFDAHLAHDFVCIEPMTTITNALNLRYEGFDVDLPMVEPGSYWEESFWAEPSLAI